MGVRRRSARSTSRLVLPVAILVATALAIPATLATGLNPPDQSLRAQYHLTPPVNWLSDPQRPIYLGGQYHLYYLHAAWDVRNLNGRTAQIQVVDNNAGHSWGHFMVDQILFTNGPSAVVGESPDQTTVNLVVGGTVVRTSTGQDSEHLRWASWNVSNLSGQTGYVEIVDRHTGSWGHINVDHITFDDRSAS